MDDEEKVKAKGLRAGTGGESSEEEREEGLEVRAGEEEAGEGLEEAREGVEEAREGVEKAREGLEEAREGVEEAREGVEGAREEEGVGADCGPPRGGARKRERASRSSSAGGIDHGGQDGCCWVCCSWLQHGPYMRSMRAWRKSLRRRPWRGIRRCNGGGGCYRGRLRCGSRTRPREESSESSAVSGCVLAKDARRAPRS